MGYYTLPDQADVLLLNVCKRMGPHGIGKIYCQKKNITTFNLARMNMLLHGVKDTDSELSLGMLVGAAYSPIIVQMKPPLILPMDSRLMPLSRARADVAQTHRFPECLQVLHF